MTDDERVLEGIVGDAICETFYPENDEPHTDHGHQARWLQKNLRDRGYEIRLAHPTPSTGTLDAALAILGNHETMGCCDPKTLEHVSQSLADKLREAGK